jgi:transketolase
MIEGHTEIILLGTGSELQLVVEAQELLVKEGINARVVSMPSWELFEKQSKFTKTVCSSFCTYYA